MLSDTPTLRDGGLCSLALKLGMCHDCFDHGNTRKWPGGARFQPQASEGWPVPLPASDHGAEEATPRGSGTLQSTAFRPCLHL